MLWTPVFCSKPSLDIRAWRRGRWCSTAAVGHGLMAPGGHINTGINAERLMGSVNITGEKHVPRMKGGRQQQLSKSRLAASTGTGKVVMAVGQRAEHSRTHLPNRKMSPPLSHGES